MCGEGGRLLEGFLEEPPRDGLLMFASFLQILFLEKKWRWRDPGGGCVGK